MRLAVRLAWRELRAGTRGLRLAVACLVLGVAAITAVGTLRQGIDAGLRADGRRILGGDLEVEGGSQALPDTLRAWLRGRGARISDTVTMRAMLATDTGARLLVELKAVDDAWPLVGAATTVPADAPRDGLLVDPLVLQRLGLATGQFARVGQARLAVRGTLTSEPDRVAEPSILGPRVMMPLADLPATALLQPGSIVEHHLRAVLAAGQDPGAAIAALRAAFPDTGWRIRDGRAGPQGAEQFLDQMALFLTLVGLSALLIGGVGVAGGVRVWLAGRARGIAILRCLGAPARLVLTVQALQLGAIGGLAILGGVVAGLTLTGLAETLAGDLLPVPPRGWFYPGPILLAIAFGVLTAASFGLAPLAAAMRIRGAALLREVVLLPADRLSARLIAINAVVAACLAGLAIETATDRRFALWFCIAAALSMLLFRGGAWGLMRLARRLNPARAWARLGLGNVHRPGAATPLLLVSVGLGLSTLAAVAQIQGNMQRQMTERLPQDAPRFFFLDIQPSQVDRFRAVLAAAQGVHRVDMAPSLRARVVALKGVPVERAKVSSDTAWALRGDRGLTIADRPPDGTKIVAGAWWAPGTQGTLVSLDAGLARGWGVTLGDTLRVNVLGRDLDLTIANLRDVAWRTIGLNFTMIASPGPLSGAPFSTIATIRSDPHADAAIMRDVAEALPNVSAIRVADVLGAIATLLGRIGTAIAACGSLTLVAGALVLAGAVAAGQQRRIRDAVVLKTLGASRAQIRAAWLVEFGTVGVTAGLIAAAIGSVASWAVMHFVLHADWSPLPLTLAETVVGCLVLMLGFGYLGTAGALSARAAPLLRNG